MLRFNTFRARRYLRSKFVEGKYLLASEATDLELEILDLLRKNVQNYLGDVAIEDAWKVERINATQILIKPGEAWFKGLPFLMRSGKDQLVSGAVLSLGTVPVGVTSSDDSSGAGKIITFNNAAVTPTNLYRIVVTAKEELLTEVEDPFLQNANLTESTAQKIRVVFQINIVPDSLQTESPVPYRDETSTAGSPTNFPNAGGSASPNFVNQITVTPTAAGNGELVALNLITGAENLDGRDVEIILRNDPGIGGGQPMPNSPTLQQAFSNGTLIDSNGNIFHINAIFNDVVSTQVVIRLDKEPDQPNPQILNTFPFTLKKREVFVTDDVNGSPQGKLHWPIATIDWNQTNGILHDSNIVDSRISVSKEESYQKIINQKLDLVLADGGLLSWDLATAMLSWSSGFSLINPHGVAQTIPTGSIPLVDGGSAVYEMDLVSGGSIARGTQAINVTVAGATSTLSAVDLSDVRKGNVVVDSGGVVAEITAIDDVNDTITTSPALSNTGAALIYKDSYGPGQAPISINSFVLAVRSGSRIFVGDGLELEDGESSEIGSIPQQVLDFIGSTGESDDSPQYSSNNYVTDGNDLTTSIGDLDNQLGIVSGAVAADQWKAPVANFAALPLIGNVNGDVRLVLDTRIIYSWDGVNWKPVNGTGSGVKIIGGGTVTNVVAGSDRQLTFTADMFLEIPGLNYADNTIAFSTQSPIVFTASGQIAYVIPNLVTGGPSLTVVVDTLINVPKNAVIIARRDSNDIIVGSSSTRLVDGQAQKIYATESDQILSFIGASDSADSQPNYSSNIRGTALENLQARAGALTDAMGDAQEDRSGYLRSDNPVTWSGTQLSFTADMILELVNTKTGTLTQHTVLLANSPISLANLESAWVMIDRTLASENLTVNLSGTLAIPAQTQANKDVIVLFRRVDALGAGYLHIPFHKQVLEPGQTVRLGASGSGSGSGNSILETLKNRFLDSPFDLMTPYIVSTDTDTLLDGTSTAAYSLIDKTITFTGIGQTAITEQLLDATEFLLDYNNITAAELLVFWKDGFVDPAATYELSRNGGNEWQAVDMTRVGSTELFRGYLNFDEEASNQTLQTETTDNANLEFNTTTRQSLSQKIVMANKVLIRTMDIEFDKVGSPTGNIYAAIVKDNAGTPSTSMDDILGESNAINITSLSVGLNTIELPDTVLPAGTYHIVIRTDATYKGVFSAGVTELRIKYNSASAGPGGARYDGAAWTDLTPAAMVHTLEGITLDLRVRVTSSVASAKIDAIGVLYDLVPGYLATGIREVEIFKFSGDLNTTDFAINNFVVNPELLKVYDVGSGQVYRHGAFTVDGNTVKFTSGQFVVPGEDVTLMFDQSQGGAFDNSDANALLLATNHLGSSDANYDKSVNGRGIFLRRPDGTLREIAINNDDELEVYSV